MATPALITGASTRATTPFAELYRRYTAAKDALNAHDGLETSDLAHYKRLEAAYLDAMNALDAATPTNWREFVILLESGIGGGVSVSFDHGEKLLADARRLRDAPAVMAVDTRDGLERCRERLDHVAATAGIIAEHERLDGYVMDALRGIEATLSEQAEKVDALLQPHRGVVT